MDMRHIKAVIEYDGTGFVGFQFQDNLRSVQGEVEKALNRMTGQDVRVAGAGRTDTGVHALGQVISFDAETAIPEASLVIALNSFLPRDISVKFATDVDPNFHARFSAKSRRYVYVMLARPAPSAMFARYAWWYPHSLDIDQMNAAGGRLLGERDFCAWANGPQDGKRTVRKLSTCRVRKHGSLLLYTVEANAFLHGMVRNLVGTLVQIGSLKRPVEDVERITTSLDRRGCGPSAPARGLCLVKVKY